MADIPSTTLDEKAFVNPQLDPVITSQKEREKLSANFAKFWETEDSKASTSPEASPQEPEKTEEPPPEPKAEETPEVEPKGDEPKAEPEPKEEPAAKSPEPSLPIKEEPKPELETKVADIDSLEPHANASESQKSQWKQLKEIAKNSITEAKIYRTKLAPILKELGIELKDSAEEIGPAIDKFSETIKSWRNGAMTPETQGELENLRSFARAAGILRSQEFTDTYVKPRDEAYRNVILEMAQHFNASPEDIKKNFTDPLLESGEYNAANIPAKWWDEQLALFKEDTPTAIKRKIEQKIANVLLLQEKHDAATKSMLEDPKSYETWKTKNEEEGRKAYNAAIADEVTKIAQENKAIAEIFPLPTAGITDPVRLEAIRKHNARYDELNGDFSTIIKDFGTGPRAAARRALQFLELRENNKAILDAAKAKETEWETAKTAFEANIAAAKEKISKLEAEVTTRRKVADAPLKPSAGSPSKPTPEKTPLPKGQKGGLDRIFEKWNP